MIILFLASQKKGGQLSIPALLQIDGSQREVLPLGRYLVELKDIEDKFVTGKSKKRQEIWIAFCDCLDAVHNAVGSIAEVWIGGSFITSKEEPSDIDVVFLFAKECYDAAVSGVNTDARFVFAILTRNLSIKRIHPLVDGYALIVPPTEYDVNSKCEAVYSQQRGYWDQFWSKTRFSDEQNDRWKYPASGYLEVIIDGYGNHAQKTNG